VVVVRQHFPEATCKTLLDALLASVPAWEAVYGGFKPLCYADVHSFFHELDALLPDM
jgi:phosphonate transport system substrate-binding protein